MSCRAVVAENLRHLRRRTGRPGRSPVKASICSERQRSVESLSLPESLESPSSPLSAESASSPVSPSLTVAPPCARTPGQTVLISSSSKWVVSTPMTQPPVLPDARSLLRTQRPRPSPLDLPQRRDHALFPAASACWREVALQEWEGDLDQLADE